MKYQLYRFKWWLAQYIVPKYPIHVDFELSSVCNLKCTFCPHSEKEKDFELKVMEFDLFKRLIDEIAGKVPSIKLNLRGESTLHPEFPKFLDYVKEKFIDIRVNTNGNYTKDIINKLMVETCKEICFSVDAFYADTYNKVRINGNLSLVEENIISCIRKIKKAKRKPTLKLSYVVTEQNKDEVALFKKIWTTRYPEMKFFIRPAMDRHVDKTLVLGSKKAVGRKNCYMPNRRLVVAANGDIYPCCTQWHTPFIILGNGKLQYLLWIWKNPVIKKLRKALKRHPLDIKDLPISCQQCASSEGYLWK